MPRSKQKFKSNSAADKALRKISVDLIEQLNLFETTIHLHKISGLTALETGKLSNAHDTELERKHYLVTSVIPSKGYFKGMRLLRKALKESKQTELLNKLDKAYEGAVDAEIAQRLRLSQTPEVKSDKIEPTQSSASGCYGDSITSAMFSGLDLMYSDGKGDSKRSTRRSRNLNRSGSLDTIGPSSCSDDDDDIISLDSPIQPEQPLPSYVNVKFQFSLPQGNRATVSVTPSPHRQRSNHISHRSNPYKATQPEQAAVSFTVNVSSDYCCNNSTGNDSVTSIRNNDTLRSVDQLQCDSPIMKFVFVGDASTGKTSLLERYINNKFSIAFEPTILVDFKSTELTCYNVKYKLHLWDTVGQERFRAITSAYYRDAVGAFVVYDVTQRMSLEHCLQWKKEIDDVVQLSNGDPIPIVLIANKIDCGQLDGEQFSKENGFTSYFETSAKTGAGIKEAIHFMVKKIHELSCSHHEPVVRTLSRNRAMSIKLDFNQDPDPVNSNGRKCCGQH